MMKQIIDKIDRVDNKEKLVCVEFFDADFPPPCLEHEKNMKIWIYFCKNEVAFWFVYTKLAKKIKFGSINEAKTHKNKTKNPIKN